MGESHVGLQARLMSEALRKITGTVSKTKTTVIFINQLREKIGVLFGNPETTSGGEALKVYAALRLDVRPLQHNKHGALPLRPRIPGKGVGNKGAPTVPPA